MIDGATSDEEKVTPVYKLEEICELLRSSHSSIVKEVSEFILKRLQHKSPIVKQKALRVIKYAVGKSGAEFRREMQRNSVAIRQLIHYKGQPEPLKGDALNKAVRETAQEALSALFSSEESKPAPTETLGGRIQGFGNTSYEMSSDDKKSFLSEVVGIGSATIKQGLNTLTQSPSLKKNDTGSYRSPNLQRSLTTEADFTERYEGISSHNVSSRFPRNAVSGSWSQDLQASQTETANADSGLSSGEKTQEERLLETIATSGGVRLQPTRDALQVFLLEASKLDALVLTHALESKLRSPSWQVCVKAICVLEAILRKKDDVHFCTMASYFNENKDVLIKCSESPQASLREKTYKVLSLLNDGQTADSVDHLDMSAKAGKPAVQMPDLIDTDSSDYLFGGDDLANMQNCEGIKIVSSATPLVDDLFGDNLVGGLSSGQQKNDDDPFADVSFHTSIERAPEADLFSGMTVDKSDATNVLLDVNKNGPRLFDIFGPNVEVPQEPNIPRKEVPDLMNSLSLNGSELSMKQNGSSGRTPYQNTFQGSTIDHHHEASNDSLNSTLSSQAGGANANPMFPLGAMQYNLPPGFMLNSSFAPQALNYNAMGNIFAQQQLLATLSSYQQLGNVHPSTSASHAADSAEGYGSALPDIFNASISNQTPTSLMNTSKKEDTKAFDFISDHLAAARDPKRVI